jgi:hypothetical protein
LEFSAHQNRAARVCRGPSHAVKLTPTVRSGEYLWRQATKSSRTAGADAATPSLLANANEEITDARHTRQLSKPIHGTYS